MRTRYEQTAGACGDDIQGCRSGVPPRRRRVWAALARTVTAFAWSTILDYAVDPKHQLLAYRSPNIPTTHLVFVVDETVRGDHLSVNGYWRPTTPWLKSLQPAGRLVNWGIASSAAISSDPSVVSLLTGVALSDRDGRAYTQPTIFHYAKAMGYETHLLDGQVYRLRHGLVLDDLLVPGRSASARIPITG